MWIQLQNVLSETRTQNPLDAEHLLTSNADHNLSSRTTYKPGFYSLRTFFFCFCFIKKKREEEKAAWFETLQEFEAKIFFIFSYLIPTRKPELFTFRRGTPSPARRLRLSLGSSGCGTEALCSPASGPPCPCPGGSSPPLKTARPSGPAPPSRQSSGPASSSCCGLAAAPRHGVWPGRRRAVTWRGSRRRRPSSSPVELCPPSPASSARPEEAEPQGR